MASLKWLLQEPRVLPATEQNGDSQTQQTEQTEQMEQMEQMEAHLENMFSKVRVYIVQQGESIHSSAR